jgi:hypothetical protein
MWQSGINNMTTTTNTNVLSDGKPEWRALPSRGLDPIFGLSRSAFYQLENAGLISFVRIRKPGNQLGRTLVNCDSVRRYFAKLAKEQGKARQRPQALPLKTQMSKASPPPTLKTERKPLHNEPET